MQKLFYSISLFLLQIFFLGSSSFAQSYDPLNPPNTFRNSDNPYYWKNRKPFEGYWQQDVYYKIKAELNEKTDIVSASEELTYWNNSPDELPYVFFHLYNNAFLPGSYYDNLNLNNNIKPVFGKYQQQQLGITISKISINGVELKTELDNTILKVYLLKPLKSGESITFNLDFKTYFDHGSIRNRMKEFDAFGYKHYDLVHWYPRISVYDRKLGWDTDQHLGREFYGDFGAFDVEISFANNYIVDATGNLLNREEVLPAELRKKLDIKNFKDKPWNEPPSEIIKPDGTWKTWKFHAENVHDFALTADPTYRIGEAEWEGIKCISLAQESHASRWQNAAEYTAKVIQTYSEDFGRYAYPKMIVADARDGMEYPMLTLDGGEDPSYRGLLAHEVGHNWFYGMVGNNETYRAALDEGFTQFLTVWAYERIDGKEIVKAADTSKFIAKFNAKYIAKYQNPDIIRNTGIFNGYIAEAAKEDATTLNTHSDGFNGAVGQGGGYGQVYRKTATMLYNLQYVLGDELFLKAMQHYFNQWKICHPYFEDFRNSIIHYTHVDLNWFFDQWLETSKTIDYGIQHIRKGENKDEYIITFKRKGRMQMPLDFEVVSKDDSVFKFHIPNTWFVKETDAKVLKRWIGWDNIQPTYDVTVIIPGGISNVIIDPSHRLADMNMLNNSSVIPIDYSFDSKVKNAPDWTKYTLLARPDLWYNGYDGIKTGLHLNGNYLNNFHVFDANVWFNTGLGQSKLIPLSLMSHFDKVSLRFNYKTATDKFMKNSSVYFSAKALEGLNGGLVGFDRKDNSLKNRLYINFKIMYRNNYKDLSYLLYPNEWELKKYNNTVKIGLEHSYSYLKGTGIIDLSLKSSALTNDYDYASLNLTAINRNVLGKININTRTYLQYGTGKNIAQESALYAAGANQEELMDNKYTRSQGIINPNWAGYGASTNYFQAGGGLNLRGYAGYLLPEKDKDGNIRDTYKGNTGAAVNAELEFDKLLQLSPKFLNNKPNLITCLNYLQERFKLNTYLFGDAGIINYNYATEKLRFSKLRADAGIGAALTIKKWGPLQTVNPLTIRFDMPLFLNRIPATDKNYVKFRWIIGVNRAF